MIKCIAIDDEPPAIELVKEYIGKVSFLELQGVYYSSLKALESLHEKPVDLVFMDINMPDLSGMNLSRLLPEQTRVIFTTAYEQYALESYKVHALDYLLKPFSFEDFLNSATKAKEYFSLKKDAPYRKNEDYFFVKADYKLIKIVWKDILFIENQKDYVKIYLSDGRAIMTLMSLKSLEEKMPRNAFMKVHRSYIVSLQHLTTVERNRIVIGKHYIPVSEAYKAELQKYLGL